MFLIHLIGWIMIASAPVLAIIAAALAMHEVVDLPSNESALKKIVDNSSPENGLNFEDKP